MNQKPFSNKGNSLKSFLQSKKGQYSLFSLLTLSVLLISGLFTSSLLRNTDTARAALNCPAGSSLSGAGTGCVSSTPSSYTCPGGQSLGGNGAQCFVSQQTGTSYSCPSGGSYDGGASCVASDATPVQNGDGCNQPFEFYDVGYCFVNLVNYLGGFALYSEILTSNVGCNPGVTAAQAVTVAPTVGPTPPNGGSNLAFLGSIPVTTATITGSTNPRCYLGYVNSSLSQPFAMRKPGFYTINYAYAAAATPTYGPVFASNATPVYTTAVTPTSYTPEPGQISSLSCTPTSVSDSGTVTCTGQGTGAPSGIPYSGNITVTIDNGGGSITTTINPDGTFTASAIPVGTIPSSTPVTKTATTNLGGTTPITVNPSSITVDPDLASGPGSISSSTDCTAATTTVTIGSTYSCSFPINGTGPFVLPTGGISARTNQALNNTTPTSACTITGTSLNILTCTAITTAATPNPLTPGVGNVQLGKGTTPSTWNTKGSVSLLAIPLTTQDIPGLTVICGAGSQTPGTVMASSTTTCTFTLPPNKKLPTAPDNLKLGIGNATPAGTCTITNTSTGEVTCTSVPTGTLTGTQPINGQIGSGTVTPTASTVIVNRLISNSDISAVVCSPASVNINQNTNCTITLSGSNTFTNLTGDIKLQISNGLQTSCPALPTIGNTLTCSAIPVGTLIGTYKPGYSLNAAIPINTASSDVVVSNPIQNSDIQSLSCSPTSVIVDTTVDCVITLSGANTFSNFTGSIDFRIGTSGIIKNCILPTTGNTLTCSALTVGSTPGVLTSQYKASGTASTFANGNDITVRLAITPLTTADVPSLNPTCGVGSQTPGTVMASTTTTCTFTLPPNKTLPTDPNNLLKLGIGNSTPAGTCTLGTGTNSNLVTCTEVPTGTLTGTQPINGQIGSGVVTPTAATVNVVAQPCSVSQPCALFESALTYSPIQTLAKRYGGSGSTQSADLILTLKDTRLETVGYTTTCTIKYKFKIGIGSNPPAYTTLADNVAYNNTTGCTGTLAKANQTLFNVDFEITAVSSNTAVPTSPVVRNFLLYANYDFKAGSIGVTSIGGSGI